MAKEEIKYALTKGKQLHYIPNSLEKLQGKKERTYTIEKVLGQGGFGITYLASSIISIGNVRQKLFFAIKEYFVKDQCWREPEGNHMMLPKAEGAKKDVETWLEEFVNEAECLNKICKDNPHIVNVNEVFRANGTAYYVMEFIDGGSLQDMISERKGLSESIALPIILSIAKAVNDLHRSHRIIHCDIKPDNIMMRKNEDGTLFPVLIDFGESRHVNSDGSLTSKRDMGGGSAGYSPLEQIYGDITIQVDVYALAATLFTALTGKRPQVASSVTPDYIKERLPENTSASVSEAIIHAMQTDKQNRTATVATFIREIESGVMPPEQPDELPIGYILKSKGFFYRIVSPVQKQACCIKYKAVRYTNANEALHPSITPKFKQYEIYEFFIDGVHYRDKDKSVYTNGDTMKAWQKFVQLCSEKTNGEITRQFQTLRGEGWATFEANNTFYLVWTKERKPLPWRKMASYSTAVAGSLLIVYGAVGLYKYYESKRHEMSQQLTEAIATNNANVLKEFAEEHDSTRAYLPYAQLCFANGDYTTTKIFAAKAKEASPQDSVAILSLYADIHEKESLLLQQGEMKRKEQAFDSLYNLAKGQYDAKQFLLAKETIEKMDREHRSRREVTVLLNKIESGLKTQELEKQYSDYLSKAQTAYKANPRRLDEALEYLKKIQSMGSDYYTRFPVKALMDDIGSKIDPSSILKDAEKKGQWDKVRELALSDYLPACGSLAKHYLKTGDTDAHCRAYYWAKKSSTVDREYVLRMLKSYGFLKDDGTPVVECYNIKY